MVKKLSPVASSSSPNLVTKKGRKPDTSPQVFQRKKIDFDLKIRELPWTEKQQALIKLGIHKDTNIIFLEGPAGSAKTTTAIRIALELLRLKKVSDMILVRAAIESSDSKMGFLPGDLTEKLGPYMSPFHDKFEEMLSADQVSRLYKDNRVVEKPIGFCRGSSWASKCVILDESQNMTINEQKLLLSRLGQFSKMIICADTTQSDLPKNKQGGFERCLKMFQTDEAQENGIFSVVLDESDIVRSELCRFIVKTFSADQDKL